MNSIFKKSTLLTSLLIAMPSYAQQMAADVVYNNAKVYTVDNNQPWATSFAVQDGKISYIGDGSEIENYIGDKTKVIDLEGKFVTPGFIDAHTHPMATAVFADALFLNPHDTTEQWVQSIKKFAKENPQRKTIVALGFSSHAFGKSGPTKEALDAAVPDRPAIVIDDTFHTSWMNSAAYKFLNITKDTPDPVPGSHVFQRTETGEPSGWNKEPMTFMPYLPKLGIYTVERAVTYGENRIMNISQGGVTAVFDAGMAQGEEIFYPALNELESKEKLDVRYFGSYMVQSPTQVEIAIDIIKNLNEKYSSKLVYPTTIKIHNDGIHAAHTAYMWEGYSDQPSAKGNTLLSKQALSDFAVDIAQNDLNIHIHAIGDKGVSEALDAYQNVREQVPNTKSRLALAHTITVRRSDIPRFGELDVVAQSTPEWVSTVGLQSITLGSKRSSNQYLFKSILDTGGKLSFGSDAVSFFQSPPLTHIEAAMTRKLDEKATALPPIDEKITLKEAIRAYTLDAAYQLNMENRIGSLEVGKYADFVIFNENLFELAPKDLSEVKVHMTVMDGNVVYKNNGK